MVNSVMLVGRLAQDIEVKKLESGKEVTNVALAVNRSFKNPDGVYETDFFDCVLWEGLAKNACEYCKCGDVIGVKGRIQTSTYEDSEGNTKYVTEVIAERITFLSSKKDE